MNVETKKNAYCGLVRSVAKRKVASESRKMSSNLEIHRQKIPCGREKKRRRGLSFKIEETVVEVAINGYHRPGCDIGRKKKVGQGPYHRRRQINN